MLQKVQKITTLFHILVNKGYFYLIRGSKLRGKIQKNQLVVRRNLYHINLYLGGGRNFSSFLRYLAIVSAMPFCRAFTLNEKKMLLITSRNF